MLLTFLSSINKAVGSGHDYELFCHSQPDTISMVYQQLFLNEHSILDLKEDG